MTDPATATVTDSYDSWYEFAVIVLCFLSARRFVGLHECVMLPSEESEQIFGWCPRGSCSHCPCQYAICASVFCVFMSIVTFRSLQFSKFTQASDTYTDSDGISKHRFAYKHLLPNINSITVYNKNCVQIEFQLFITNNYFLTSNPNLLLNNFSSHPLGPSSAISKIIFY